MEMVSELLLLNDLDFHCSHTRRTKPTRQYSPHIVVPVRSMHGRNICARLSQDVGEIGTWIIVLIAASCYLIYVSNETINIIRKILTPQEYIKQKSQKIKTMLSKASQTIDTPNYATTASTATLEETDEPKEYEDPQTISLDLSNKTDDETIPPPCFGREH